MSQSTKVGINPFPWFADGPDTWTLTATRVADAVQGIANAGFSAMQADLPDEMTPAEYGDLLVGRDVRPAPSYWGVLFDSPADAVPTLREEARRRASAQTELGLTQIVIADELYPPRVGRPGVGAAFEEGRLDRIIERIGEIAAVLVSEGLSPCFHQHVGSWIETEAEVRTLLDAIDQTTLAFAPDIAHLAWAGADPARLIRDYASRVSVIHLKDAHLSAAELVRTENLNYDAAVYGHHVFTEPGRGDVDLDAVLKAVPDDYDGWWVAEVDVPDLPSKELSTEACARWIREHILDAHEVQSTTA